MSLILWSHPYAAYGQKAAIALYELGLPFELKLVDAGDDAGMAAFRATGAKAWIPFYLPYLARAQAALGKLDEAWRCVADALSAAETTKEMWCAAEIHRKAGDIQLGACRASTLSTR